MRLDLARLINSPIESLSFNGQHLYIKRDDLLGVGCQDLIAQAFNGNKARKLYHYLVNDFPGVDRLVSYGSAQSNMLFSLSVLAQLKGWSLDFYVDHIPSQLKQNPVGNYAGALKNGVRIHSLQELRVDTNNLNIDEYVREHAITDRETSLLIPEGGSNEFAEPGIQQLADEITQWVEKNAISNPTLMLPSGTGTTAFYLQKHLSFQVLTCACVGGHDYLQQQCISLSSSIDSTMEKFPKILHSASVPSVRSGAENKKYHFGKLYPEFYQIWQELKQQTGICFELLYDPLGWLSMMDFLADTEEKHDLIYLHQGGLLGNESMLPRYQRAFPAL